MQGGGGSLLSGCEAPAPVRVSETGRARNWTMPPLRLERECKERTNSATIYNRCVEFDRRENQRCAFTMAEILLSLTIIGVVAAITLPSLTGNINERTWNTQRKALYARFSQAIPLMDAINGYGTLQEMTDSATGSTSIEDTAAETFITGGLSKVMKINNICDNEHLADCGITSRMTALDGVQIDMPATMQELNSDMVGSYSNSLNAVSLLDTKAAAFETANGESVAVYYNPRCVGSFNETGAGMGGVYYANKVCANFVYDLNGNKGPNTVGKDIGFMTAMYPSDVKVAAPIPAMSALSGTYQITPSSGVSASAACTQYDSEYKLPNIDELIAMGVNKKLIDGDLSYFPMKSFWSASKIYDYGVPQQWDLINYMIDNHEPTRSFYVWCVKR